MRKFLLALQKRNNERLVELRGKIEKGEVRAEDLEAVKKEVDDLNTELQEIADKLENMDDEEEEEEDKKDEEEKEEDAADEGTDNDEGDGEDTGEGTDGGQRDNQLSAEQRSNIMSQIGKGLSTKGHKSTTKKDKELRSAFANFVVGKITEHEARSLGLVTGNGAVTVPKIIASEVITYAQEENLLRKYGTRVKTKDTLGYPVLVKQAGANVNKGERSTDIPDEDIEFDEVSLEPAEFDALCTVSKKLLKRSDVPIETLVVNELKKAYVRKETNYMFNGDDVDHENAGALAKKAVPFYEGAVTDLYKNLVKFKGQPVTEVLKKSMWIVNRAAFTELEGLLDANGRPLLHEAVDGMGYKLLGHRLDFTDAADGADPSVPVFYFGDFSQFYIQDVLGVMEIQRLVEEYAKKNKVGFQIYHIVDGQLIYSPFEPAVYRYEVGATPPTP